MKIETGSSSRAASRAAFAAAARALSAATATSRAAATASSFGCSSALAASHCACNSAIFAAAFCFLFFSVYLLLYAWYDAIVNDSRFILSIFLPFIFAASLFVLKMGRDRMVSLAGWRLPFAQFLAGLVICLSLIDVLYNASRF